MPFKGAVPPGSSPPGSSDDDNEEEDNDATQGEDDVELTFIVDDDDEFPADAELPEEFSMNSHQDLSHQFKSASSEILEMEYRLTYRYSRLPTICPHGDKTGKTSTQVHC